MLLGNALLLGNMPGSKSQGVVQQGPNVKPACACQVCITCARKIRARSSRIRDLESMSKCILRMSEQVTSVVSNLSHSDYLSYQ